MHQEMAAIVWPVLAVLLVVVIVQACTWWWRRRDRTGREARMPAGNVRAQGRRRLSDDTVCMRHRARLMRISIYRRLMDERIHFIYHQGKKVLLVDLSNAQHGNLKSWFARS